jgi:hypothetical protein
MSNDNAGENPARRKFIARAVNPPEHFSIFSEK